MSWKLATPEPVLWGIKAKDHVQLVAEAGLAGIPSTGKHLLPSPAVLGCASCVKLLHKAKPEVWIITKELAVFSLWHSLSPSSDVCILFLSSRASVARALHSHGMRGRLSRGAGRRIPVQQGLELVIVSPPCRCARCNSEGVSLSFALLQTPCLLLDEPLFPQSHKTVKCQLPSPPKMLENLRKLMKH